MRKVTPRPATGKLQRDASAARRAVHGGASRLQGASCVGCVSRRISPSSQWSSSLHGPRFLTVHDLWCRPGLRAPPLQVSCTPLPPDASLRPPQKRAYHAPAGLFFARRSDNMSIVQSGRRGARMPPGTRQLSMELSTPLLLPWITGSPQTPSRGGRHPFYWPDLRILETTPPLPSQS